MNQIQQVTRDSLQRQTLYLADGSAFTLTLYYMPMQQGWFIRELTYGTFKLNGVRITNSPNLLHQFRNRIPFGIGCFSKEDREPMLIDDFVSGNSKLYLLTEEDTVEFNRYLTGD